MRRTFKSLSGLFTILLTASSPVWAQGIAAGSGEVAGTIGISSIKGVDANRHLLYGFSGFYNVTPWLALGGDYIYQSMGSQTLSGVTGSGHLQLIGPVARFSVDATSTVLPYVLVGGGALNYHAAVSSGNLSIGASQNGLYFVTGGGASIYASERWGIRPEFRYARLHFNSNTIQGITVPTYGENDYQGTVTIFYQFGGRRSIRN